LDLATLIWRGYTARRRVDALFEKHGTREQIPVSAMLTTLVNDVAAGDEAKLRLVFHNLRFAAWAARLSMGGPKYWEPIREVSPKLDEPEDNWGGYHLSSLAKYGRDTLPLADRVQAGVIGLIEAAGHYMPSKRAKFTSFATWYVRNEIVRAVLSERYRDGLTRHGAETMAKTVASFLKLRRLTGSEPSMEMVAADTEQGTQATKDWLTDSNYYPRATLEDEYRQFPRKDPTTGEVLHPGDLVWQSDAENGPDRVSKAGLMDDIEAILDTLSEREAGVIWERFGLGDGHPKTLDEIGRIFGVTRERIRQIETKAMSMLRNPRRSEPLRAYLYEEPDWPWHPVPLSTPAPPRHQEISLRTRPDLYDFRAYPWLRQVQERLS